MENPRTTIKLICNVKRKMSCTELFRTLSILPVPYVCVCVCVCVCIMETVYYFKLNNEGLKQNLAKHDYKT